MRARVALCVLALTASLGCDGSDCNNVETDIGAICIPDALAANLQSTLDVREACGSDCAQQPSCTAIVLSGAVYFTLREDQCSTTVNACIATQCNHSVVPCTVPALGPGDYPVVVSGGPGAVLRVRATGTSGCHLPQAPEAPDAGVDGGS